MVTSRLRSVCLDRVYLNGYVPNLQVAGQVVALMTRHLGFPIPSPAIMEKIGNRFRRAVNAFAQANDIPIVGFGKEDRKIEVMRRYLDAQAKTASRRWWRSGWPRSTITSSPPASGRPPVGRPLSGSTRPTGG